MNYEELTLCSDTFQSMRDDFDLLLQKLFQKMETSKSLEGSIDLKITIEIKEDFILQDDGTNKRIEKPILKHRINTVVPVKDSADGKKDTGMELVYDNDLRRYVLKYVSTGGQMSIFDMEDTEQNVDGNVVDATPAIQQAGGYFLLGNSANEETEAGEDENGTSSGDESTEPIPFSEGYDEGGFPDSYDYDEPED